MPGLKTTGTTCMDNVLEAMDRNYSFMHSSLFICFFFSLGDEIPSVKVPQISVLRHGESTTFSCNLTNKHQRTGLKRISWYKDGILLESIRNPDPDKPLDTLRPLVLENIGVRDGGNYTCFLEVELRNIRMYNVSDSTMVKSKCTVD